VSRYLVIAMALIAAGFKSTQGAWVEAVGLSGLAAGLTALKLSGGRPAVKSVGYRVGAKQGHDADDRVRR
jgi:hypothetical protein